MNAAPCFLSMESHPRKQRGGKESQILTSGSPKCPREADNTEKPAYLNVLAFTCLFLPLAPQLTVASLCESPKKALENTFSATWPMWLLTFSFSLLFYQNFVECFPNRHISLSKYFFLSALGCEHTHTYTLVKSEKESGRCNKNSPSFSCWGWWDSEDGPGCEDILCFASGQLPLLHLAVLGTPAARFSARRNCFRD